MALDELLHPGEHHDGASASSPKKKSDRSHHDNMVIIVVGVISVILTFLIWRGSKQQKAAASSGGLTSASIGSGTGQVLSPGGSAGGVGTDQLNQLGQALVAYQKQLAQDLQGAQAGQYAALQSSLQSQQDAQQSALQGFGTYLQNLTANLTNSNRPASPTTPTYPLAPSPSVPSGPVSWLAGLNPNTGRQAITGPSGEAAIGAGQLASTPGVTQSGSGWLYQGQQLVAGNQAGVGTVYYVPGQHIDVGNVGALGQLRSPSSSFDPGAQQTFYAASAPRGGVPDFGNTSDVNRFLAALHTN